MLNSNISSIRLNSNTSEKENLAHRIARYAHEGQMYGDKGYFKHHILGVVRNVELYCRDNQIYVGTERYSLLKISAYLHDTLEDSPVGEGFIRENFGDEMLEIVECLTRKDDETYFEYILRVKDNEYARIVKVADIKFNLSECLKAGGKEGEGTFKMVERYKKALSILTKGE